MSLLEATYLENTPYGIYDWYQINFSRLNLHDEIATLAEELMSTFSLIPMKLREIARKETFALRLSENEISLLDCCRISFILTLKQSLQMNILDVLPFLLTFSDDEEKISIIKGFSVFDPQGQLVDNLIELTRSNSIDVFSSIALFNEYPAQFFNEASFNQLVLKALFCDLNIENVIDLPLRKNKQLVRMVLDYKQERINANRSVPNSLNLAI